MNKIPMTVHGAEMLRQELEQLKKVERPAVISAISEARAHGDLKENAEYHAAKERQGFIEGRIQEIESKMSFAQVIDVTQLAAQEKVVFGATVTLENTNEEVTVRYQIVGEDEADIKQNKLSIQSPTARALIGKHIDDEAIIKTPSGEIHYLIKDIEFV